MTDNVPATADNTAPTGAAETLTTPAPVTTPEIKIEFLPDADPDTAAYVKNKGWDKAGPSAIVQSYRNLEKLLGADRAGRTVEIPGEGADETTLNQFYEKIGRPATPEAYELPIPEGQDKSFAEWAKGVFHKHGIPAKAAAGIAEAWNEYVGSQTNEMTQAQQFNLSKQHEALKGEWGAAFDRNTQVAKAAVQQLGIGAEQINALEAAIGFDGVMKMFHKLGTKVGEDSFVSGSQGRGAGGDGAMTPAEAKQALDALMRDKEFLAAWQDNSHPGHKAALDKKARLSNFMAGVM